MVEITSTWRPGMELEPVQLSIVQECRFKAKPCKVCGKPKSNAVHKRSGGSCEFRASRGCANCGEPKGWRGHFGAPPSINVLGSGDRFTYVGMKERWQEALTDALLASKLPKGLGGVYAEGDVTFPDRAARDQGNFRVLIEKALGDALEAGGWIENDDWTRYEFGNLTHHVLPGRSATQVVLFPRAPGSVVEDVDGQERLAIDA